LTISQAQTGSQTGGQAPPPPPPGSTLVGQGSGAPIDPRLDFLKAEYDACSRRYNDIYSSVWRIFSYLAVAGGAVFGLGTNDLHLGLRVLFAGIPIGFWYFVSYRPLDLYACHVAERAAAIESQINALVFPGAPTSGLRHFTEYVESRKNPPTPLPKPGKGFSSKLDWSLSHGLTALFQWYAFQFLHCPKDEHRNRVSLRMRVFFRTFTVAILILSFFHFRSNGLTLCPKRDTQKLELTSADVAKVAEAVKASTHKVQLESQGLQEVADALRRDARTIMLRSIDVEAIASAIRDSQKPIPQQLNIPELVQIADALKARSQAESRK
jgi:hypothetical protein